MLCLPMAAMGETYVCKEQVSSWLMDGKDYSNSSLSDWVIDLDSGFRVLADNSDYRGSCQKLSVKLGNSLQTRINCSVVTHHKAEHFRMQIESGFFTHTLQTGTTALSSSGKCTEI